MTACVTSTPVKTMDIVYMIKTLLLATPVFAILQFILVTIVKKKRQRSVRVHGGGNLTVDPAIVISLEATAHIAIKRLEDVFAKKATTLHPTKLDVCLVIATVLEVCLRHVTVRLVSVIAGLELEV